MKIKLIILYISLLIALYRTKAQLCPQQSIPLSDSEKEFCNQCIQACQSASDLEDCTSQFDAADSRNMAKAAGACFLVIYDSRGGGSQADAEIANAIRSGFGSAAEQAILSMESGNRQGQVQQTVQEQTSRVNLEAQTIAQAVATSGGVNATADVLNRAFISGSTLTVDAVAQAICQVGRIQADQIAALLVEILFIYSQTETEIVIGQFLRAIAQAEMQCRPQAENVNQLVIRGAIEQGNDGAIARASAVAAAEGGDLAAAWATSLSIAVAVNEDRTCFGVAVALARLEAENANSDTTNAVVPLIQSSGDSRAITTCLHKAICPDAIWTKCCGRYLATQLPVCIAPVSTSWAVNLNRDRSRLVPTWEYIQLVLLRAVSNVEEIEQLEPMPSRGNYTHCMCPLG